MPINFPDNPSVNDTYVFANVEWEWDGEKWVSNASGNRGPKGEKGDTGDTGPQGEPGVDGANGVDGSDGAPGQDGNDGLGFTGGSYSASTGVVTFTSDDGLGFTTGDLRGSDGNDGAPGQNGDDGDGFTGGSYDASTGVVTFTSDDGLGFSTGDLRGADGAEGPEGPEGPQGPQGEPGEAGGTPAIFYALGSGSANLGTSLGTIPLATPIKSDTGYSVASNEVTIGSDLNDKWAEITWAVAGSGATNRVEVRSQLEINGVRVKGSSNYVSRNTVQDRGGIQGFHIAQLSTGDVIRVRALRDGSTCNLLADETHLAIQTL
ncbi:MAG: collagen-like protein [Phaeodactylibacter sp.]|nr:collagen-like protein [Phaeodactylibacter sp.]